MGNKYTRLKPPDVYEDPDAINYQLQMDQIDKLMKLRRNKRIKDLRHDESMYIQITSIFALIHCGKIVISDKLKNSASFKRLENSVENKKLMDPRDVVYFLTYYKNETSLGTE